MKWSGRPQTDQTIAARFFVAFKRASPPFALPRAELEIFFRFWTRGKREWIRTYGEEAGAYVRVIKSGRVEREFLGERKFELLLRGGRVSSRA